MKLDDFSKQQLAEVQSKTQDKNYTSSITVPLLQNILGGLGISIILVSMVAFIMYSQDMVFYVIGDQRYSEASGITYTIQVILILTATIIGKVLRIMKQEKMEDFMDIYLAVGMAFVAYFFQVQSFEMTKTFAWWFFLSLLLGIIYGAGLTTLRFSSEESIIARVIFSLGARSNQHVITSLRRQVDELKLQNAQLGRELGHVDLCETKSSDDVIKERRQAHADAMVMYSAALEGEDPTVRYMRHKHNINQERTKAARDALIRIRAIDVDRKVLDRNYDDVELRLAHYVRENYKDLTNE